MQTHMRMGGAVVQTLILKKKKPKQQKETTPTNNPKTFLGLYIARVKSLTAQNSKGKAKYLSCKKKILV